MNVALPALVVFFVLLPGFIARSGVKRVERTVFDYSPFGQIAAEAVVWCLVLHAVWIAFVVPAYGFGVDMDSAVDLLATDGATQRKALAAVGKAVGPISLYFASLLAFAFAFPRGVRWLISRFRLDRSGSLFAWAFRFDGAPWYYLLSAADFAEDEKPDFIVISAVVEMVQEPFLYVGVLENYYLTPDGGLDRLVLSEVMRRPLSRDKADDEASGLDLNRFYHVDGDYFVLRYSEVATLNVEYIRLREEPAGA